MPGPTHEQVLWLAERAGVFVTEDRVVHVRGEDARSWLNGQVSNDLRTLTGDQARYAVALTVKGRVISDLWALEDAEGMAFVVPGVRADAALARFDQYIIMEDVELVPDLALCVVTVQGPAAGEVIASLPQGVRRYACARLTSVGFDCWLPIEQRDELVEGMVARAQALGGGKIDAQGWAEAHVALGVPRVGIDFGEDSYPQEAGLGPRALSFGKGCYLGQEVVYMLENRGQLARRLVQLQLPGQAAPGALLSDEAGKRVGELTSVAQPREGAPTLALGYVKRASSEVGATVWLGGSPARVVQVIGLAQASA